MKKKRYKGEQREGWDEKTHIHENEKTDIFYQREGDERQGRGGGG